MKGAGDDVPNTVIFPAQFSAPFFEHTLGLSSCVCHLCHSKNCLVPMYTGGTFSIRCHSVSVLWLTCQVVGKRELHTISMPSLTKCPHCGYRRTSISLFFAQVLYDTIFRVQAC